MLYLVVETNWGVAFTKNVEARAYCRPQFRSQNNLVNKKPTFEEFPSWCTDTLKFDPCEKSFQNWIKGNSQTIRATVESSPLLSSIEEFCRKNIGGDGVKGINMLTDTVSLNVKSIESILSKIFRHNVVNNRNFPSPPKGGWVDNVNLFQKLNDIVRSKLVCRHIDEPAKIANAIVQMAQNVNLHAEQTAQAKEDGYYAYHVYITMHTELVDQAWNNLHQDISFEIQITTQMQSMLYDLTHLTYDKERVLLAPDRNSWKWDYRSSRFIASYLSHTLHLLEGLILRLHEDLKVEVGSSEQGLFAPLDEVVNFVLAPAGETVELDLAKTTAAVVAPAGETVELDLAKTTAAVVAPAGETVELELAKTTAAVVAPAGETVELELAKTSAAVITPAEKVLAAETDGETA